MLILAAKIAINPFNIQIESLEATKFNVKFGLQGKD